MNPDFRLHFIPAPEPLTDFVESIGMFHNISDNEAREVVVLPDGRIDLFFWQTADQPFQIFLIGLETAPEQRSVPPQTRAFVISFKPLAVEYILKESISNLLNTAKILQSGFWDFTAEDLDSFDAFYQKITKTVTSLLPSAIDERKRKLFGDIYASKGEMSVKQLSENAAWTSRQINRYFNQQFGLSLKVYCNILRFRASLPHIADGKLFPELNFSDQNHFIKEIKKFSGVVPAKLNKNENDRFILLSVLKQQ